MEIQVNNPEDGIRNAENMGNQLIAEVLYQMVVKEEKDDKLKLYLQLIKLLEELSLKEK